MGLHPVVRDVLRGSARSLPPTRVRYYSQHFDAELAGDPTLGVCVGIAVHSSEDTLEAEELLAQAELALGNARNQGAYAVVKYDRYKQ